MEKQTIKASFLLRAHGGYTGIIHVFSQGSLLIWSETTPIVRRTISEALTDATRRAASLQLYGSTEVK